MPLHGKKVGILIEGDYYEPEIWYYQHRFDRRQLAEYLNMKPKSLPTFAEKFAGGGL